MIKLKNDSSKEGALWSRLCCFVKLHCEHSLEYKAASQHKFQPQKFPPPCWRVQAALI